MPRKFVRSRLCRRRLYVRMSVGLYVLCLCLSMSACQYASMSVCQNVSVSVYLYVCISVCQYVCMSVCQYVSTYVCMSVCQSVCMPVYTYLCNCVCYPCMRVCTDTHASTLIISYIIFYLFPLRSCRHVPTDSTARLVHLLRRHIDYAHHRRGPDPRR